MTTIEGIGIPDSKLCKEITEPHTETELLFNHSSRVYYFGALTGLRRGLQFDREMEWINELVLPGGDVAASDRAQGSIFFVGNATVILSYAGFTILTDPNFLHRGDHVHLGHGMTAARRTDPALELEALPPIDFVLLSHMHEDHFDREVERRVDHSLPQRQYDRQIAGDMAPPVAR
jgi:hypothetical protein